MSKRNKKHIRILPPDHFYIDLSLIHLESDYETPETLIKQIAYKINSELEDMRKKPFNYVDYLKDKIKCLDYENKKTIF